MYRLSSTRHLLKTLQFIDARNNVFEKLNVTLTGKSLTIPILYALTRPSKNVKPKIDLCGVSRERMSCNAEYLAKKVESGCVIYGVNTGYGGSADVRSDNVLELQRSLIRHLNAGFGDTLPSYLVKAVMAVRVNSLALAFSGVRPSTVQLLVDMFNHNIVPVVPKRGSVSASGDLMPSSYIASCMIGRTDAQVTVNDVTMTAPEALNKAGLEPVVFQGKEALAVVNSASFSSSLAALVLYDANIAIVLTQIATALTCEALCGCSESFHPTIHNCLPHSGQQEVATNLRQLLHGSKYTRHTQLIDNDKAGVLKQDRYALRSAPQWLAPVIETTLASIRRVTTELNSVNDNPLIDDEADEILHGANFQGTSLAVAMDQQRQALQLCGKLLFAQMQELVNHTMNDNLPPNLAGADVNIDFGFKGMDTAMASYMSELDYLSNNVTNHVLSAELHNQAVNSMALVSARYTQEALELLHMMLANILLAQCQAIDLRYMKAQVELSLTRLLATIAGPLPTEHLLRLFPWYKFVFSPRVTTQELLECLSSSSGGVSDESLTLVEEEMRSIVSDFQHGTHVTDVQQLLGQGTRTMYSFIRRDLDIPFYYAQATPDVWLKKIFRSLKDGRVSDVFRDMFKLPNDELSDDVMPKEIKT